MIPSKVLLYNFCKSYVDDFTGRIQKSIEDIQESLSSETKSSAGDKHETGRAMLQLEREKLGTQLAEAEKLNQILAKVSLESNKEAIGLGSLVITSKATYFIAISAGMFEHEFHKVYCISLQTPIAKLLFGKTQGDVVHFNNNDIYIQGVL